MSLKAIRIRDNGNPDPKLWNEGCSVKFWGLYFGFYITAYYK